MTSDAVDRQEAANRLMAQMGMPGRYVVVGGTDWVTVKVRDLTDDLHALLATKLDGLPYRIVNWNDEVSS
ncbi:hypothetical protein [Methylobacterium brachythecii]|uniref:Uncharacterized protein n=1 Tax=Methylobacterium brachythecii TaxID=1176177 RepID=A0A7W6F682_9HYPH|nr:hypothetical protein [Methylobacterium brachythecii]MBB3902058.1 hypothetical protein [Methylobacterium brachythecii]GLS44454.1 hypothetical protein GCM10007884_24420 [Methylobacterium brachythecii]